MSHFALKACEPDPPFSALTPKDQWALVLALLRHRTQNSGITPEMEAHYRAVVADVERYWKSL